MSQPQELFDQVISISKGTVAAVDDAMLELPTPCSEWNVRQLINHMAITCRFSGAIVDGNPPTEDRLADEDVLGSNFRAAYAKAADAALQSFSAPGAMERMVEGPVGQMPGSAWVSFPTWDLYVHTWDLATATGVAMDQPEGVTGPILGWAQQVFSGERDVDQLGEILAVAEDAPSIDRLMALFGRTR